MPQVRLDILLSLVDKASGALGNVRGALNGLEQRLQTGQKQAAAFNEKWGNTLRLGQQVGAGMTAAGAGIAFVAKSGIEASMELEGYRAKLEVALKDATKAAEMYDWAKKKAASTPFEMADVVDATTRLEMYGLSATEWFDKVGNMAGAMGKDVNQAVEAIADAVSGGGLERLKEFGVSATKLKELGWSGDYSAEGIKTLKSALEQLMERDFGGGMEKMMGTAKGAMSNFSDAVFQIKAAIGDALLPAVKALTPILTSMANVLAKLAATPAGQALITFGVAVGGLMIVIGPLLMALPALVNGWQMLTAIMGAGGATGALKGFAGAVPGLVGKLSGLAGTALPAVQGAISAMGASLSGIAAAAGPIAIAIIAIAALAYELYKLKQAYDSAAKAGEEANKKFKEVEAAEDAYAARTGTQAELAKQRAERENAKVTLSDRFWGAVTGGGRTSKDIARERVAMGQAIPIAGKRAAGGPVLAGGMYLVGEDGPELFAPQTSGQIIPNADKNYMEQDYARGSGNAVTTGISTGLSRAGIGGLQRAFLGNALERGYRQGLAAQSTPRQPMSPRSSMPQIATGGEQRTVIEIRLEPGLIAREVESVVQSPGVRQAIVSIGRMAGSKAIPQAAY